MKYVLWFLTVIFALIVLILFLKLRLSFEYVKNGGEKGTFSASLLVFDKLKIPFPEIKPNQKKPKKEEKNDKEEKKITLGEKISKMSDTVSAISKMFSCARRYLSRRVAFEKCEVYVKFGSGDAAVTGVLTGALWALLYQILALLCNLGKVREHSFDVVPVYDNKGFCTRVEGIISFRLINIIVAAVKVGLAALQEKIKNRK